MKQLNDNEKIEAIKRLANHNINQAMQYYIGLSYSVERAFVEVLENAELIRGFTKNDKMKCRHIGIVIGYYVRTNRYVNRLVKDKNKEFIQNGYAYVRANHHD